MAESHWIRYGLVTALVALAVALFDVGWALRFAHHGYWEYTAVGALVAVSVGLQLGGILMLLRRLPGCATWGRRIALLHGAFALLILGVYIYAGDSQHSNVLSAWMAAYVSGVRTQGAEASWQDLPLALFSHLLPLALLAQWAFLKLADSPGSGRIVWSGVAISCVSLSAVLGLWTFSGMGQPVRLFEDGVCTFFNIGVAVHLLALWQIAVHSKLDWLWAGLIGFGCLVSGSVLAGFFNGPLIGSDSTVRQIGGILNVGWFELGAYLPVVAYVLTAVAAVVLFQTRELRRAPSRHLVLKEMSPG